MTVAELLERISSAELSDWFAFYEWEAQQFEKARRDAEREARRG